VQPALLAGREGDAKTTLVSMEKGKHRFPSRTPQLSPSSVTILGYSPGKIARGQIIQKPPETEAFVFSQKRV
jgi:hypothetical protein